MLTQCSHGFVNIGCGDKRENNKQLSLFSLVIVLSFPMFTIFTHEPAFLPSECKCRRVNCEHCEHWTFFACRGKNQPLRALTDMGDEPEPSPLIFREQGTSTTIERIRSWQSRQRSSSRLTPTPLMARVASPCGVSVFPHGKTALPSWSVWVALVGQTARWWAGCRSPRPSPSQQQTAIRARAIPARPSPAMTPAESSVPAFSLAVLSAALRRAAVRINPPTKTVSIVPNGK